MEVSVEFLKQVKQSLSIAETSTLKDGEIELLIQSGIQYLNDFGIEVEEIMEDSLLKTSIILFVKSTFGNVDIKEKERALKSLKWIVAEKTLRSKKKNETKEED